MSNIISETIAIPADMDGFILLQCPLCGTFFKIKVVDMNVEDMMGLWCPNCGIHSESYFTDEVMSLVHAKAKNILIDKINKFSDDLENKYHNSSTIKVKTCKLENAYETRLKSRIDALEIVNYLCCSKQAKVNANLRFMGGYCPFCGGIVDGD